jgi:ATP/ADP translocase
MFWQFVNHLFKSQQAKRIYPILAMIGNIGLICAGNLLIFFARIENFSLETVKFVSIDHDKIEVAIKLIIISVTISGIIAIGLFRNVYNNYVENHSDGIYVKDTKTHLTLRHSVKLILSSRYIFYVSILVISYGLTMNILEGPWKAKLSELYTNPCDYIEFMGNFNIWMGVSSVIMTIIGGNILRYFGWVTSAYITPVMITITGSLFFTFVVFGKKINLGFDPIYAAVMIGAIQNILSKSSKNSLFDSTKEMAYIPLSIELKTKGKAAVEIMGAKIGKSMGAFLQFLAFTIMPDLDFDRISIFLMLIFIAIAILWLIDVNKLSKEYNKSYNAQNN